MLSMIAAACPDYFFIAPRFSFADRSSRGCRGGGRLCDDRIGHNRSLDAGAQAGRSGGTERSASGHHRYNSHSGLEQFARRLDQFLNKRVRDYAGLSLEEGRGWAWMNALHPEDRAMDDWRAAIAAGEPFEKEARLRRADGE